MAITNSLTNLGNLSGTGGGTSADYKVSNLYKQAYTDAIRLQIQQYDSVLSDTLEKETIEGEVKSFDKLLKKSGTDILVERTRMGVYGLAGATTSVGADTADADYGASDTERRMIEPKWFEYAELFDPRDETGLMKSIRPDSQYMRNLTAIFNQKKDQIILDSLTGTVLVQQRTGQGQTSNKTMAYGTGLTAAQVTARGLLTGVTQTGDYTWTGETAKTLAHYNGYEGHEIGCKLSRKYENLFAQGESAGTLPDTAAILSGGSPNDQTPLVSTKPGADTVGLVSIAGGATLDSLALDSTTTTLSTTGVTPFNIEKLIRARQKLDSTHALRAGGRYICVLHPDQFYSLMADASDVRFNSIDFNDGKPLINGEAFRFMGFEFRMSTLIPQATVTMPESSTSVAGANWSGAVHTYNIEQSGSPIRYAYFYTPQCGIFGTNANMEVRFDEIPERGYALQMWHQMGMNAIRMDGDCLVRVASVDEPA